MNNFGCEKDRKEAVVAGCGISGAVCARLLAEKGYRVTIYERRNHIGGNMYDYKNDAGILVHKYGPHIFHTKKKELYEFMCRYADWIPYDLTCGAVINKKYTPTPFNFSTIDDFYAKEKAEQLKNEIKKEFPDQETATVLELLEHKNDLIREYAKFLFDNDYSLYTAKQWGISPDKIDKSVLKRVPIRFNYDVGYFDDDFQAMPEVSYTSFFENILNHPDICVKPGEDFLKHFELNEEQSEFSCEGKKYCGIIVYTGAIDELFGWKYGKLPYRSLRFEWKTENKKSFQPAPVVAYPQEKDFTRITEYTKLPVQDVGDKTTYAVEYPIPYSAGSEVEPYYPIPNEENFALYSKYRNESEKIKGLYLCGRLADYQYYNMDQALEKAIMLCGNF